MMKERRSSIKAELLMVAIIPTVIIGVVIMILGIIFMKNGMEEEIIKGLLSSAYTYKDIGITVTDREAGDNEIESTLKNNTGYDFTWFDGDTRKNSSLGSSVIGTQAADTVISAVIGQKQVFTSKKTQVAGTDYFVAYVPVLDENKNVTSMAFTGVSRESVNKQIQHSIIILMIVGFIILIIAIVICYMVANTIAKAINAVDESITHLANGEFIKADKYLNRKDEIGKVLNNTNGFIDKLQKIVSDILTTTDTLGSQADSLNTLSDNISTTITNVTTAVEEVARGATDQAENIQDATTNVSNIDIAIQNVSDTASNLTSKAHEMSDNSQSSEKMLLALEKNLNIMSENIGEVAEAISATNSAVDAANTKVEMINNIASQTNLLALNASIEAARAGDAGRGFSVVATEIGALATNSNDTANQIKEEMTNLLKVMQAATEKTDSIQKLNETVIKSLRDTVENTQTLMGNIEETVEGVNTVTTNVDSCKDSKVVIVDAMSSLSAISEENAASTEETSASMSQLSVSADTLTESASDLAKLTETLREDMKFFKIG